MPDPTTPATPAIPPKDAPPAPDEGAAEESLLERVYVALEDFRAVVHHGAIQAFKAGQTIEHHTGELLHRTGAPVRPVDDK